MTVLLQSMAISKAGLPNLDNPGTKYKDKVPNVSDSNQNIETSCKSKLKLSELKDLYIKSSEKLVKDESM